MSYELTDYKGQSLTITSEQADSIANIAELIEIEIRGQKHYLNPKNIASIRPTRQTEQPTDMLIDAPDYRGRVSKNKEKIRQMLKDKGI